MSTTVAPEIPTPPLPRSLAELEAILRRDFALLDYPRPDWVRSRTASDGRKILDVLIIGGGQGGLAVAHALMREKVRNLLVIDENPEDQEGPWRTFARMITLRTPKHLCGPDGGLPNLTPRAWYEAQYGTGSWDKMGLIPKETWADYLKWYRRFLGIPVRNNAKAGPLRWDHQNRCFVIPLNGDEDELLARKVVLATGIDGSGRWIIPEMISANLPKSHYAHTREEIDFAALKGRSVAILGAGASAFDNASVALETGAGDVHLFFRRPEMVRVNPYRWAEFVGFLRHHGDLPDEQRWRFILQILRMGQLPPADTFARATQHHNFHMHPASPWQSLRLVDGRIQIQTPKSTHKADYIIIGTGFRTDLSLRPELQEFQDQIALWRHRFSPPHGQENEDLANHPYLGPTFEFQEKQPGQAPFLRHLYNYTFGCLLSLGFGGASISGMKYSIPRLVSGITRDFYAQDIDYYFDALAGYDEEEF